jgi:hypothetical protein
MVPAHLQTEYTVRKNGVPREFVVKAVYKEQWSVLPSCQSIPSALGGEAFGQDKHRLGLLDVGPMR